MTPIRSRQFRIIGKEKDVISQAQTGTGRRQRRFGIPVIQNTDPDNQKPAGSGSVSLPELAIRAADEMRRFCQIYAWSQKILPDVTEAGH